jgi:hypothetical protein
MVVDTTARGGRRLPRSSVVAVAHASALALDHRALALALDVLGACARSCGALPRALLLSLRGARVEPRA